MKTEMIVRFFKLGLGVQSFEDKAICLGAEQQCGWLSQKHAFAVTLSASILGVVLALFPFCGLPGGGPLCYAIQSVRRSAKWNCDREII